MKHLLPLPALLLASALAVMPLFAPLAPALGNESGKETKLPEKAPCAVCSVREGRPSRWPGRGQAEGELPDLAGERGHLDGVPGQEPARPVSRGSAGSYREAVRWRHPPQHPGERGAAAGVAGRASAMKDRTLLTILLAGAGLLIRCRPARGQSAAAAQPA